MAYININNISYSYKPPLSINQATLGSSSATLIPRRSGPGNSDLTYQVKPLTAKFGPMQRGYNEAFDSHMALYCHLTRFTGGTECRAFVQATLFNPFHCPKYDIRVATAKPSGFPKFTVAPGSTSFAFLRKVKWGCVKMLSCSSWFMYKESQSWPKDPSNTTFKLLFFPSSCRKRQLRSSGRASAETTTHRMSSKFSTCQSDHEFLTYNVVRKLWDPIGCHATTWQATISAKGHRRDLQSISWWNGSSRETPTLKRPRKRLVAEKHRIQDVCLAMETGRSFGFFWYYKRLQVCLKHAISSIFMGCVWYILVLDEDHWKAIDGPIRQNICWLLEISSPLKYPKWQNMARDHHGSPTGIGG